MQPRSMNEPQPAPGQTPASFDITRRRFLLAPAALAAAAILGSIGARVASAATRLRSSAHPEPRPGITGERILAPADLKTDKAKKLYDQAREIPEVLDGIHCYCECHDDPMNHRSLLSCFESDQAAGCYACGKEARLVHKLHGEGRTLDEIRAAVDREFA